MDTIFAEATPPGRGGVSVVRISGPESHVAAESLVGSLPEARKSYLRAIRDGDDLIDRALILRFDEGSSFTGEDVVEIHLHGAPVVVDRLCKALVSRGLRRAEAGEFTRRAFLNGSINLAEAEGLSDLLSAETEAQRKLAMRAAEGELGVVADHLRAKLIRAGALVEVSIDFADEEVPEQIPPEVFDLITDVRGEIEKLLTSYPATERLRQGYVVAIIGPPNIGKSSLFNRIAQRELALVTNIAGTTRDILELHMDLRGLPVTFLDTAGLRESSDPVEAMGIERALERAESADLRVILTEGGVSSDFDPARDVVVRSKADLNSGAGFGLSSHSGEGVSELLNFLYSRLRNMAEKSGLVGHRRQAEALRRALVALCVDRDTQPEFIAEALRQASQGLAELVGKVGVEDYLDEIFSSFCIGK